MVKKADRIKKLALYVRSRVAGTSNASAGRALGVARATVFKWVTGNVSHLSADTLTRLSRSLNCEEKELKSYLEGEMKWSEFEKKISLKSQAYSSRTEQILAWLPTLPMAEVIEIAHRVWALIYNKFKLQQFIPLETAKPQPGMVPDNAIAQMTASFDLSELSELTGIPANRLFAIAQGSRPSDEELTDLGVGLVDENGEFVSVKALQEIRDRAFKNKNNGEICHGQH